MTNEEIQKLFESLPDNILILEPQTIFNRSLIGYNEEKKKLVYDYDLMISALANDNVLDLDDDQYMEIVEYIDYNILNIRLDHFPMIVVSDDNRILNGDEEDEQE